MRSKTPRGLILDLRGNSGGRSSYADAMAGRLLSEPLGYRRDTCAARTPTRSWRKWMTFRVKLREPPYTEPVAAIMETLNMSSAEQFLIALVCATVAVVYHRAPGTLLHLREDGPVRGRGPFYVVGPGRLDHGGTEDG